MGVLEQVTNLKNRGLKEDEIVGALREQGISPKEINDALGQSQIKSAVDSQNPESARGRTQGMEPSIMRPERAEPLPTEGSAPSDEELTPPPSMSRIPIAAQRRFGPMTQEVGDQNNEEYVPQPIGQNSNQPNQNYQPYPTPPQSSYQQEYAPQQAYNSDGFGQAAYDEGYGGTGGIETTDTMIEIAEQVFSEKIKTLKKQMDEFNEFKTLGQTKIDNISERLKRIETNIDRLQSAILEKVGSYGRGLDSVKKEMSMMQNSFGKVVSTLANKSEHHKHTQHTATHKTHPKKTTRKTSSKKK